MTKDSIHELISLFERYSGMPNEDDRIRLVESVRKRDPEMAAEFERLIAAESDSIAFLEQSCTELLSRFTSPESAGHQANEADLLHLLLLIQPDPNEEGMGWLDTYLVRQVVAVGRRNSVLRAWDPRLEREVAIKVLTESLNRDPETRAAFVREPRIASRLRHPNVVTIHEVRESETISYYVMEWVDGGTLKDRCSAAGSLQPAEFLGVMEQLAAGLNTIHEQGIIHRDLKPQNVLFVKQGARWLLADFGLATNLNDNRELSIAGTPAYMSPEHLRGDPVTYQSEIFSLGCVAHELLLGQPPFQGENLDEIIHAVLHDAPCSQAMSIPAHLQPYMRVIERALEKQPERRFASVSEMWHQIEQAATHSSDEQGIGRWKSLWRNLSHGGKIFVVMLGVAGLTTLLMSLNREIASSPADEQISNPIRQKPQRKVDESFKVSLFRDHTAYLHAVVNAKVQEEPARADFPITVRYWRPVRPSQIAEIIYRIPLPKMGTLGYAELTANLSVYSTLDHGAYADLSVANDLDPDRWYQVASIPASRSSTVEAGRDLDVTDVASDASFLFVRARLYSTRIISHPGPEDILGPATAQFLRNEKRESESEPPDILRLGLYRQKDDQ